MEYDIDILNSEYWCKVYIGKDKEYLNKLLKKHTEEYWDLNGEFRGKCFMKDGFAPLVWVNTKHCKGLTNIHATLAHEAIHAIDFIFNTIGSNERGELFAHSVASIIRKYKKQNMACKKRKGKKK